MLSGTNGISSKAISLLFGPSKGMAVTPTNAAQKLLNDTTGNIDDVMRTGGAIGTIIALASQQDRKDTLLELANAERVYTANGEYSQTFTGQATVVSDAEMYAQAVERAKGTDAVAVRTRAYLSAMADGSLQTFDMTKMGVTSTMAQTNSYHADGTDKGSKTSYDTRGMDQFLATYVEIKDGLMYDKATGKNASIGQNGTQFTYSVW
jgi:hypothetical protein